MKSKFLVLGLVSLLLASGLGLAGCGQSNDPVPGGGNSGGGGGNNQPDPTPEPPKFDDF